MFAFVLKMSCVKSDVHVSGDDPGVRKLLKIPKDEPGPLSYEKSVCGHLQSPQRPLLVSESYDENYSCGHSFEFPCVRIKANFNWIGQWEGGH